MKTAAKKGKAKAKKAAPTPKKKTTKPAKKVTKPSKAATSKKTTKKPAHGVGWRKGKRKIMGKVYVTIIKQGSTRDVKVHATELGAHKTVHLFLNESVPLVAKRDADAAGNISQCLQQEKVVDALAAWTTFITDQGIRASCRIKESDLIE